MKWICLILLFSIFVNVSSQNVTVVDPNLKARLLANKSINSNGDTEIQLTEANAFIGVLDVSYTGIADLTGVEAFVNTKVINCNGNSISSFDFSSNVALQSLYINDNQFSTLDISANINLIFVQCSHNNLINISFGNSSSLTNLYCSNNQLTTLDLSNVLSIREIHCFNNPQLTSLIATGCVDLLKINCSNSILTTLDLNSCAALISLDCSNAALISLYVANGINNSFLEFDTRNNSNLTCIEVDNVFNANSYWPNKDVGASYSQNCP